jgi:carbonic anhydrase
MMPEEALERLLVGNRRYAAMQQIYPRQTMYQRQLLVEGQNPIAAILSCSDSRVPAELIFDQGLGDLFIVRTAGHAVNDVVLASLEYAVHVLHVPLIVVMGHAFCGAVTAVVQGVEMPGFIPQLGRHLAGALQGIDRSAENAIEQATFANSRFTTAYLVEQSGVLREAVEGGALKLVTAYYDLNSGQVKLID